MKREFLDGLKLDAAVIDQIMSENGKDIEREKQKALAAEQQVRSLTEQLEAANQTIEKFSDYDQAKADVEKYKAEAETARTQAAQKIAELERSAQIKDFLSGKKFVNDITREAIAAKLGERLTGDDAKGKSLDELLTELTKDMQNVYADEDEPKPPRVPTMGGSGRDKTGGVAAAFRALNPGIQFEE